MSEQKESKGNKIAAALMILLLILIVVILVFFFIPELREYKENINASGERISAVMNEDGTLRRKEETDNIISSPQNPTVSETVE